MVIVFYHLKKNKVVSIRVNLKPIIHIYTLSYSVFVVFAKRHLLFLQKEKMDDLTIHGLPRITKHKKLVSKVFWGAVFIGACSFLSYVLYHSVRKYRNRNFITKISKEKQDTLQFPTITICDTDMVTDFINMKSFPKNCSEYISKPTENKSTLFTYGCRLFLAGMKDSCIFGTRKKCSYPINYTAMNNWNLCYTFNREGTLHQLGNGRPYGLEMLLFKNNSNVEVADIQSLSPLRTTRYTRGLLLMAHSSDEYVGFSLESTIPLVPGTYTEVVLKKQIHRRLEAPYPTNCSSHTTVPMLFPGAATEKNCRISCAAHQLYKICGDVPLEARPYMNKDKFPSRVKNKSKFNQCRHDLYENQASIKCDCNAPCYKEIYETKVFSTQLRKASFTANMRKDLSNALNVPAENFDAYGIQQHVIRLSVFYESFIVDIYIDQPLQEIADLLSNFGGLMGLFVGASVISLLELVWLSMTSLFQRIVRRQGLGTPQPAQAT